MKTKEVHLSETVAASVLNVHVTVTATSNPKRDVLSADQRSAIRVEAERLLRERNNARFLALREKEDATVDQSLPRLFRREALDQD